MKYFIFGPYLFLLIICSLYYVLLNYQADFQETVKIPYYRNQNTALLRTTAQEIPFVVTVCEGRGYKKDEIGNLLRELKFLFISASLFTKTVLRFIVITYNTEYYQMCRQVLYNLPQKLRNRIIVESKIISSSSPCNLRRFPSCYTIDLFFHEIFPKLDTVIYIDLDFIFLRPPELLFKEFKKFNEEQIVGMTQDRYFYELLLYFQRQFPVVGEYGVQAGIVLLNLTRMRRFREGRWSETIEAICQTYDKMVYLGDQCIFNILFSEFPDQLHMLDCKWNFMLRYCYEPGSCPTAEKEGISAIHGAGGTFSNSTKGLKVLFEALLQLTENGGTATAEVIQKIKVQQQTEYWRRNC